MQILQHSPQDDRLVLACIDIAFFKQLALRPDGYRDCVFICLGSAETRNCSDKN